MSSAIKTDHTLSRIVPMWMLHSRKAARVVERNVLVYRRTWLILVSGVFEPLFYLLSIGVGIEKLVGDITGPGGSIIKYSAFVAPGLMASSAMNGAIYDSTFNIFWKLKYAKTYDTMLATPMGIGDIAIGEITWALIRGLLYAAAFLVVALCMGLLESPWALLALPAATLIGFAFAAAGVAGTSYMRNWQDFDFVQLAILPMFLFSTSFYPLSTYPRGLQIVVQFTPLFHGVSLLRGLCLGSVGWSLLGNAAYLLVMGSVGLMVAGRRLEGLLLK